MTEPVEALDAVEVLPAVRTTLYPSDSPALIVARAKEQAQVLADVIEQQELYVDMGADSRGRQRRHITIEGWTLLGNLVGVYPVIVGVEKALDGEERWAEPVLEVEWRSGKGGKRYRHVEVVVRGVGGWQATAEARTRDGAVVGRAIAECRWAEPNWQDRDSYAVLSMAETRACSKVLRTPLDFIVRLAGYTATPAEEIPAEVAPPEPVHVELPDGTAVDMAGYLAKAADDDVPTLGAVKRLALVLCGGDKDAAAAMYDQALANATGDNGLDALPDDELLRLLVVEAHALAGQG